MRNTTVLENYGKVVIGKALVSLDTLNKGKGIFYEAILFDKALELEDLEKIKKVLKLMYDFTPKIKVKKEKVKVKPVVDSSLLQNFN